MALLGSMTSPAIQQLFAAWGAWLRSFGYLKRENLRAYHLVGPGAIVSLSCLGWLFSTRLNAAVQSALHWVLALAGLDSDTRSAETPEFWSNALSWGVSHLEWLLHWGVMAIVFWIKVKIMKYLLLTMTAPFMGLLSAAIRTKETGQSTSFSVSGFLHDVFRGFRAAFVLFVLEISLTLALAVSGLLLTVFAPPLALVLSPVLFVMSWTVGSYFYGAAVFDVVFEQEGLDWKRSIRRGWQQKGHLTGIGMVFSLLLAIPIFGTYMAAILGPIPCAAAASTLTFQSSLPAENPS